MHQSHYKISPLHIVLCMGIGREDVRANSIIWSQKDLGFTRRSTIFWLGARQASEYLDAFCVCVCK